MAPQLSRLGRAAAMVAAGALLAASPAAQAGPATYTAGLKLDAAEVLAPPPATASERQATDLSAVRRWQDQKTSQRWLQAQRDDDLSPFTAFSSVLGPRFTPETAPRTKALFDVLFADVKAQTGPAKAVFGRPRPPLVDTALASCAPLEKTASYPSGHAARGWLMALTLSEMVPEQASAILARGRDYGDSRVVCAEHFPSDVEAGRLIGAAVFAAAQRNNDFQRDLKKARKELRKALDLS